MDLFSRKIISRHISGKPDVDLVITAFKKEEINRRTYHSLQDLQLSVFEYIEGLYNSKGPHGALGLMTPNEKEELFRNQA